MTVVRVIAGQVTEDNRANEDWSHSLGAAVFSQIPKKSLSSKGTGSLP